MTAALCLLILCIFVVAGLAPFRQTPNEVTWLTNQRGVHFGKHGIILSARALPADGQGACSIEMWLRPAGGEDSSTLLAFYGPSGGTGVSLQRSLTDFRLDRETDGGRPIKSYVNDVLRDYRLIFLTVVLSSSGTVVYRDGAPVRKLSWLRAAPGDCSGNLGVGHPAKGHTSWQGDILGLAIYHRELTSQQVWTSYRAWRKTGYPDEHGNGRPDALYLFEDKRGTVVRDHGTSGVGLIIPDRYQVIQRTWLESPVRAFEIQQGYVQDILINIGGFVPFGFALSAFLASMGLVQRVSVWTVVGGLLVSLTIETLQTYLPTRNSDLTDVLTNTLGSALGAATYALWQRRLFSDGSQGNSPWASQGEVSK